MKPSLTYACTLLIAITPLLTACGAGGGKDSFIRPGEETAALAMWIWLAADQDTTVRCEGPFCTGGDSIHGFDPLLDVQNAPDNVARTYVQFTMPSLPAGSIIEEAYLELFQSDGTPGTYGQELISFVPTEDPWRPGTTTYNNQPRSFPGINQFDVTPSRKRSGWWTSPNLKRYADYKLANPQLNYGFVTTRAVNNGNPIPLRDQARYSFFSNNSGARTPLTVGNGPRFLMKVTLPAGATLDDVSMPPLAPGHDLLTDADGKAARALLAHGDAPPAGWNAGAGQ